MAANTRHGQSRWIAAAASLRRDPCGCAVPSAEAESEALRAWEELRPYLRMGIRAAALTELGRIRLLRNGDLVGAEEAFLEAHEIGWDPQPGLALLRFAQGDVAAATSSIRYALDHPLNVPSKEAPPNSELRRATSRGAGGDRDSGRGLR